MFQNSWDNPTHSGRTEITFAHRHKEYGAYIIRKLYRRHLATALLIAVLISVVAVAVPLIGSYLKKISVQNKLRQGEEIILSEPPSIDKLTPPPPVVIPPPPVQQTIKFTPPKVVKDEEAKEPPPTQEEMKDIQISTTTQAGTNVVELPPENPVTANNDDDKIFTIVEEMPEFTGGEEKMFQYFHEHTKYPGPARENNLEGKVYVKFMVDKDGKVCNAELLKGIGGGCDEEALRVINSMPAWKPGKQNGRNVKVRGLILHIDFRLK